MGSLKDSKTRKWTLLQSSCVPSFSSSATLCPFLTNFQSWLNSDILLYLAFLNVLQMADLFGYGHKLFPYLKQMHYDAGHQDLRRNTPAVSCSSLTKQQPTSFAPSWQELCVYMHVLPALMVASQPPTKASSLHAQTLLGFDLPPTLGSDLPPTLGSHFIFRMRIVSKLMWLIWLSVLTVVL